MTERDRFFSACGLEGMRFEGCRVNGDKTKPGILTKILKRHFHAFTSANSNGFKESMEKRRFDTSNSAGAVCPQVPETTGTKSHQEYRAEVGGHRRGADPERGGACQVTPLAGCGAVMLSFVCCFYWDVSCFIFDPSTEKVERQSKTGPQRLLSPNMLLQR